MRGTSFSGNGVFGLSTNGGGVIGQSAADNSSGIGGINTGAGPGASGVSVGTGDGVHGISNSANGVLGTSGTGTGVHGVSSGGQAGQFDGSVVVNGDFTVTGAKSAAVVLPDGSEKVISGVIDPEFVESYKQIA